MKRTIIAVALCLVATPAYADSTRIESPRGITQSEWNASDAYRNFQCADNQSRGEGVDMNFTTNRSDDYWFVECTTRIVVPIFTPVPTPTPTSTQSPSTTTPTVVAPETTTVVTDTATAKIETATVLSNIDITSPIWFSEIMAWFNNFIKQFYALLEGLKK